MRELVIWTMEQDYCDNCGAYLYEGGKSDDNSGLCSTCFDLWLDEQNEDGGDYEDEDWQEVGELKYEYEEWERGLPPMPAPPSSEKGT